MKVAVIQTSTLPYEKAKINYFLSILRSKGVKVVVIPEYVLNLFFKDLENTPLNFIKQQSEHQFKLLKKLAHRYNMTIIAPITMVEDNKIYKVFYKFSPKSVRFYYQQIFMPYEHWNEKKFFSTKENKPLIFKVDNIRIALLPGFEIHFDGMSIPISIKELIDRLEGKAQQTIKLRIEADDFNVDFLPPELLKIAEYVFLLGAGKETYNIKKASNLAKKLLKDIGNV